MSRMQGEAAVLGEYLKLLARFGMVVRRRWRGQAAMYYARYDRETDTLTEVPTSSQDKER